MIRLHGEGDPPLRVGYTPKPLAAFVSPPNEAEYRMPVDSIEFVIQSDRHKRDPVQGRLRGA